MPAVRHYPALDLAWPQDPGEALIEVVLAELDPCHPTAVEERASGIRVFFTDPTHRDRALAVVQGLSTSVVATALLVPDEAWAERSQAALQPVRIGRFVISPPWIELPGADTEVLIRIQPSMGFGTGHHASTRLCLAILQTLPVSGMDVLDVGTGSGVLAIAASRIGARRAIGIDVDTDALISARENIELNHTGAAVELAPVDLAHPADVPQHVFDVVLANLTG